MRIAVLGATGYVGGRLVPHLLDAGHELVCLSRTPRRLDALPWRAAVEVRSADVLDAASLIDALNGCEAVCYLVHAMGLSPDFAESDRVGALNTAQAARCAGVRRIVYLGGLGEDDPASLSQHLASRHEVGRLLASSGVEIVELRAAVIIGSGSASFEMLRNLVEVLPMMVCPKWVTQTRCQPVAIADVLHCLAAALTENTLTGDTRTGDTRTGDTRTGDTRTGDTRTGDTRSRAEGGMAADPSAEIHRIWEIGGPDVVTYRDMMNAYARCAGLPQRFVVPVPVLTPRLSSHWVKLVTPLPYGLARPLVDSLANDVVVTPERDIRRAIDHTPLSLDAALQRALSRVADLDVSTSWMDSARGRGPAMPMPQDPAWSGGTVLCDERVVAVDASPEDVFATVSGIGGERGWYAGQRLWELRGMFDKLIGGVGMRRGRRHPDELRVGDAVDFFRVEVCEAPRLLRLRAEMRLPGDAWLEWETADDGQSGTLLHQRAKFHPKGVLGRLYWWSLVPLHAFIFRRQIARLASDAASRRAAG